MKELNFTMGEALKLLNITEGTIRNYEKKGLISSKRQDNNGYRFFTYKDLNRIESVRKYRNLGLSLSEIKDMLCSDNIESTENILEMHRQNLLEEAKSLTQKANKLNDDIAKINKISVHLDKFSFVKRETFCFYPFDEIVTHKKIVTENLFDEYASILPKSEIEKDIVPRIGYIQRDNTKFDRKGKLYPECQCLYTVIKVNPTHKGIHSFKEVLMNALSYIDKNNMSVCEDILGIKLLTLEKLEEQYDYYELYIPIEEK